MIILEKVFVVLRKKFSLFLGMDIEFDIFYLFMYYAVWLDNR